MEPGYDPTAILVARSSGGGGRRCYSAAFLAPARGEGVSPQSGARKALVAINETMSDVVSG